MSNVEQLVEDLSNLSVMDMAKLKELLEDKWGVTAAAAAVAVAPAAGGAAPDAGASESTEFEVSLTDSPADKKIAVIKVVREITGLGLKEAKEIAESAPKVLKPSVSKAEADEILKKLEEAGAKGTAKGL